MSLQISNSEINTRRLTEMKTTSDQLEDSRKIETDSNDSSYTLSEEVTHDISLQKSLSMTNQFTPSQQDCTSFPQKSNQVNNDGINLIKSISQIQHCVTENNNEPIASTSTQNNFSTDASSIEKESQTTETKSPVTQQIEGPISNFILMQTTMDMYKQNCGQYFNNSEQLSKSTILPKHSLLVTDNVSPRNLNVDETVTIITNTSTVKDVESTTDCGVNTNDDYDDDMKITIRNFSANITNQQKNEPSISTEITDNLNMTTEPDFTSLLSTGESFINQMNATNESKFVTKQPKSRTKYSVKHDLMQPLEILEPIEMILIEDANDQFKRHYNISDENRVIIFKSRFGQPILYGIEEIYSWNPLGMCTLTSPFEIKVYDMSGMESLSYVRQIACVGGCFSIPLLWQTMSVYGSNNSFLGCVKENLSLCIPQYTVYNHANNTQFIVRGQINRTNICNHNVPFLLYDSDMFCIGSITNNWDDNLENSFIYRHNVFGIKFPHSLVPRLKILLLSAAILIKYTFYNRQTNDSLDGEEMIEIPSVRVNVHQPIEEVVKVESSTSPIVEESTKLFEYDQIKASVSQQLQEQIKLNHLDVNSKPKLNLISESIISCQGDKITDSTTQIIVTQIKCNEGDQVGDTSIIEKIPNNELPAKNSKEIIIDELNTKCLTEEIISENKMQE